MNYNIQISPDYHDFRENTLKKLTKSKTYTRAVLDYWDDNHVNPLTPSMNANVYNCGSWLKLRHYEDLGKNTLHKARFCKKDKLCPACAARRSAKQVQKVHDQLVSNIDILDGRWYYIVLPVVHSSDEEFMTVFARLQDALKAINQSIRNVARGKNSDNWFSRFDGIMYSIEETKTDNGWNIHANLLCRSKEPITGLRKKRGFNTYWHANAVATLSKIADGSKNISISPVNVSNREELIKNLQEVFKYSLKFQELSPDDLLTAYRNLYRRRLLGTMGTLRNLKTDVNMQGDDIEDAVFVETLCTYTSRYVMNYDVRGKVYKGGFTIYEAQ